jgi:hypothetical protein
MQKIHSHRKISPLRDGKRRAAPVEMTGLPWVVGGSTKFTLGEAGFRQVMNEKQITSPRENRGDSG